MKFQIFIDKDREEQVVVYVHQRTELTDKIEQLVLNSESIFSGYKEREIFPLNSTEIFCFTAEDNKVFATTEKDKFQLKFRLYELEQSLSGDFIKINKSFTKIKSKPHFLCEVF